MTPVTRPQGPLPARIYWVRRALVLGTAFLLVFGLARLLGGGSDGSSGEDDRAVGVSGEASQSAASDGASDGATDGASDGATDGVDEDRPRRGAKAKAEKTPLAQPDGACEASDLTVEADLKRTQADDEIEIPLTISGTADACTWTVSNESLALKITSGADQIWSSQQCARIEEQDVVVRSAKPAKATFTWNGRRSDEECSRTTAWAMPGSYHVVAAPFGGEPSDVQFELTKPRPEKIFKPGRPKRNKSDDSDSSEEEPSAPKTRPTTPPSGAVEPNG